MPSLVTCPFCRKQWQLRDGAVGRASRCPRCGAPGPVGSGDPSAAPRPDPVGRVAAVGGTLALALAFFPRLAPLAVGLALITAALAIFGLVFASVRSTPRGSPALGLGLSLVAATVATLALGGSGRGMSRPLDQPTATTPAPSTGKNPGVLPVLLPVPVPVADGTFTGQDQNRDGLLNVDELPITLRDQFAAIDTNGDGYASPAEYEQATTKTPATPTRGRTLATSVYTAADDFVVDVWRNGKRLPETSRRMVDETFGATAEQIEVEVKEGDWLVFSVVNNRYRWGGVAYFGAAGVDEAGRIAFESSPDGERWSYSDDPSEAHAFITRPGFHADRAALAPANPWLGGDEKMRANVAEWAGKPVWGRERLVWIKYVAPAPGTAPGDPTRPKVRLTRVATLGGILGWSNVWR